MHNIDRKADLKFQAHDLDKHSNLRYDLVGAHGGRIPFAVRTDSGTVFVKEPLDYEKNDVYHLKLLASDGLHNATTDVYIYVQVIILKYRSPREIVEIQDVNDNAPIFEQSNYVTTVYEEDINVPKVNSKL